MNREQTMLAVREMLEWGNSNWADGVEVQYAPKQGKGSRFWTSTDNPLWNWEHYDYRRNAQSEGGQTVSDTLRTDAEAFYPHDSKWKVCDADFASQLERELNAANVEIEEKRKDVVYLATEKAKLEERIKRLEDAGDELRECASRIGTVASGEGSVIRRTQEAIQAWAKEDKP
jgi:hypothetical protein